MDTINPLDGSHGLGSLHWIRNLCYLPSVLQLLDRLVPFIVSALPPEISLRQVLTKSRAASVFAANTILRSGVGAAFPLFSKQMFNNLGVQWAGTLLGCLAFIMIPIPLAFMKFGPSLRARSSFAPAPAVFEEKAE